MREHQPGREQALARADRTAEVVERPHVGQMACDVGHGRVDVGRQPGPEGEQAPQADDHARDAGQDLYGEAERP